MSNEAFIKVKRAAWMANVSVKALCRASGVNESTVWRWKYGRTSPNESTLNKILKTADELAAGNEFLK